MPKAANPTASDHGPEVGEARAGILAAGAEFSGLVERLIRREGGITLTQYRVLGLVDRDRGGVEPRQIARSLGLGSGHLTAVLDGLEQAGLIVRNPHPADGRRRLVSITDQGVRRQEWLEKLIAAAEDRILGEAFDADERATLVALLERLRATIALSVPPGRRPGP